MTKAIVAPYPGTVRIQRSPSPTKSDHYKIKVICKTQF